MTFETFEFEGGVIVPGTFRLERMQQEGRIGFAVIAGVFDTRHFPGRKEDFVIGWAPFIGIAEWMRDYIDSGGKAKLDIKKAFPSGVKIGRAYVAKRYGHLHSIQTKAVGVRISIIGSVISENINQCSAALRR